MLRAPLGELDNWGHDSRCSASIAGSLSRGSAHSRIAHAEAIVVSCDNRPTAVLAFFQYIRMGSAACAEQFDANRSFAVQACFHRAGYCTAPGELDRTPVAGRSGVSFIGSLGRGDAARPECGAVIGAIATLFQAACIFGA